MEMSTQGKDTADHILPLRDWFLVFLFFYLFSSFLGISPEGDKVL